MAFHFLFLTCFTLFTDSRFIHITKMTQFLSCLWLCNIPLYICTPNFFICSSVSGLLYCFCVLAVVNSAAVNIGVHVSFWIMVFLWYVPSSRFAGSYGSFIPSSIRNLHPVLCSGGVSYISTNSAVRSPFLHIISNDLLFVDFLMMAILTDVRW